MQLSTKHFATLALLTAAIVPVLANERNAGADSKEARFGRMIELQREIEALRAAGVGHAQLQDLTGELNRLSDSLGGDLPTRGSAHAPAGTSAELVLPACGFAPTSSSFSGTTGGIGVPPVFGTATFTALVATPDTYLWDVNLTTAILHSENQDLDITLTSPGGTTVTITTDNGGTLDNLFNGTVWNDNVNDPVTDKVFTNNVTAATLSPEGRLQNFRGENPNGTWTLTITDDLNTDVGTLTSWSLDISTLAAAPGTTTLSFPKVSGLPVGPGVATTTDTVAVSGLGTYLFEVELITTIPHPWSDDIDMTLASPSGPAVKVVTDNTPGTVQYADVFNGTLWDVDAPVPVTDYLYVNQVTATPLAPEGAFDNWLGQDPNGVWTLVVADDFSPDGGTLVDWTVTATTIPAPTPSAPVNYPGTFGPIPDATAGVTSGTFAFTALVSGMPISLWDVDLNTTLTHENAADLDITLTSPAGTVVTVTTDNGGTNDNVFNGTLWDDNVNAPVTDFAYVNLTAATPISPEGRFAAFRGEDPNGVWTLTVIDDAAASSGNLAAWSLGIAALPVPVPMVSNTYSQAPGAPIPDNGNVTDVLTIVDPGTSITEVELTIAVLHAWSQDLDITLTSPGGTTVTVTTDNGSTLDNVFNGSLFDPSLSGAAAPVTDATYANNVPETPISPEGSFDNFLGQNPNGNWTLSVTDDAAIDAGTLVSWGLTIRTCSAPPVTSYCFGDGSSTFCPCSPVPVPHGGPGRGCPTNIFAQGALATAAGNPSISADTFVLTATEMINGSMIFYQGPIQQSGGMGAVFGDGKRCVQATSIRRFKTKTVVGNTASYPVGTDVPIHTSGAIAAPGTRNYQGWYRSANPLFCTPDTYNLTNGLHVIWGP